MQVDRAVPLALLATELITETIRLSFPNGFSGTVNVRLESAGAHDVELSVDNNADPQANPLEATGHSSSLSASLIQGFATQLGGEIGTDHTKIFVRFPLLVHAPTPSTSAAAGS
jgi:two-component sensor histidine kinase